VAVRGGRRRRQTCWP